MKILFIEENDRLSKEFKENTNYQILRQSNLSLLSAQDADFLVVDNQTVSHQDLLEKKDYFSDFKEIFFVTEQQDLVPLLMINHIKPIPTSMPETVLVTIEEYIYSASLENKVFVFMGTDRRAGVTSITHAIADGLGEMLDKKVLLINLSDNYNEWLHDVASFDELKSPLRLNNFTVEDIGKTATRLNNYYYIGASEEVFQENENIELANRLYKELKTQSEYIVLLDLGSNPNSSFYVVALDFFKNIFLVTRPLNGYQRVFKKVMDQVLKEFYKLDYKHFLTIVNCSNEYEDLADKFNVMLKIPESEIGKEAENKGILLHKLDVYFYERIQTVCKYIGYKVGYHSKTEEKKKGWLSRFKRNKEKVGEPV